MFNLKYKFKKVIRFIHKILRVILIFGVIACMFCINANAAIYRDSVGIFEVFEDSDAVLTDIDGNSVAMSSEKLTHTYAYHIPSAFRSHEYINFTINNEIVSRVSAGNVISLKGMLLFRDNQNENDWFEEYLVDFDCPLSFTFSSVEAGYTIDIDSSPEMYTSKRDNRPYARYDFNIVFTVPEDYDYYRNFKLGFLLDLQSAIGGYSNQSLGSILIGSDEISLYVGDEDHAPIYPEYGSNTPDEIGSAEDQLKDDAANGLSEAGSFVSFMESIFNSGGQLVAGLQFVNMFITDLYTNWGWLNSLLVISLALGVLMIILGIIDMVGKRR